MSDSPAIRDIRPQSIWSHQTSDRRKYTARRIASASSAALATSCHTWWSCPAFDDKHAARLEQSSPAGGHEALRLPARHRCYPCIPFATPPSLIQTYSCRRSNDTQWPIRILLACGHDRGRSAMDGTAAKGHAYQRIVFSLDSSPEFQLIACDSP